MQLTASGAEEAAEQAQLPVEVDPREPSARFRQDPRAGSEGLSRPPCGGAAERGAAVYGPDEVRGACELRRALRRRRTAVRGRAAGAARQGRPESAGSPGGIPADGRRPAETCPGGHRAGFGPAALVLPPVAGDRAVGDRAKKRT